ncbi:MAG: Rid family detoxifying hydrolase [Gammaproteobacteria bacterium]|nr:Rid family detoxifying hydrolase [Gammaproteobacteria bacterium]MCW5583172.1 Rid family detoxifying hydrolase [Gammaproteobacteria bacterium]
MDKRKIHSPDAPLAIGPYSQAIEAGGCVYFSGQIALDPKTMTIIAKGFPEEAVQVFTNLQAVCQTAGGTMDRIAKLTIYLTDLVHFPIVNEVMARFFTEPFPARTTIQVSALPKAAQIEIDAVMVL